MNKKLFGATAALLVVGIGTTAASWPVNKPTYVLSSNKNVTITPFATTGDKFGDYTLRGIPDGMGAYKNEHGQIVLLSNHEVAINTAPWTVSN